MHDRMPVVIKPEEFARWLDCRTQEPRDVADLLSPVDDDYFDVIPVSDRVNKVANTGADLQTPVQGAERPEAKPPVAKPKDPPADPQLSLF